MNHDSSKGAAFAFKSAYLDLQDAISAISSDMAEAEIQGFQLEAEKFIVSMLASITLVDGQIREEEAAFLCELVNIKDIPGGAVRFVNQYACRWPEFISATPKFFSFAIERDHDAAHEMLCMIQLIGNNAAISDGHFAASEHQIVRDCIARLEAALSENQ